MPRLPALHLVAYTGWNEEFYVSLCDMRFNKYNDRIGHSWNFIGVGYESRVKGYSPCKECFTSPKIPLALLNLAEI